MTRPTQTASNLQPSVLLLKDLTLKDLTVKHIYAFTENERAYVQAANEELLRRLRNVAEINGVQGNVNLAPDGSGFVSNS